jgi:hypothetical protein
MNCWQDIDKTIPAVRSGDPVAVMEAAYGQLPDFHCGPGATIVTGGVAFNREINDEESANVTQMLLTNSTMTRNEHE